MPRANGADPTAPVELGTAEPYAVLAAATITNTGPTVLGGDLGLSAGSAITGFPPGLVTGDVHTADLQALAAKSALVTAYDNAAGRAATETIAGDQTGRTLGPGVYQSASQILISGTLTLDGGGDANAVFILQSGSDLITGPSSRIVLTGGAQACNVFWQVGSSATLDTYSTFEGTILALTSITVNTGAAVEGRVLARNGQVSFDSNQVTVPTCAAPSPSPTPTPSPTPSTTPTPSPTPSTTPTPSPTPSTTPDPTPSASSRRDAD